MPKKAIATGLCSAARRLRHDLGTLSFEAPVALVYDPSSYARRGYQAYLRAHGDTTRRVVFLGMNPGPFGMVQTGVPFGDVEMVRDFLGIEVEIDAPPQEHPKRPVNGFACTRREVSGTRLWGAIAAHFRTPKRFFAQHFVANYCPLAFVEATGRNRTPDKLPKAEREPLYAACDRHLRRLVTLLEPEWVVGIGAFAQTRAREVLGDTVKVGRVLHPSPANPRAQKNWGALAHAELVLQGVWQPGKGKAEC